MPSFRSTIFALAATFVATASADYIIDPKTVNGNIRSKWCLDQRSSCPIICRQTNPAPPLVNTCDPETLTYGCVCGDNKQPNISEYSLTIPFYTCQEYGNVCVKNCGLGNNACAQSCRVDHPCGAQNPSGPNATAAAAEASASAATGNKASTTSAAPGSIFSNGVGGGVGGGQTAGVSGWEAERGRIVGMVGLLGGLAAGFAML